jgi:hypothetical protein
MIKKLSLFLVLCAHVFIGSSAVKNSNLTLSFLQSEKKIDWKQWLPAIRSVESSNYIWAKSYLGEYHGRGLYQISEIALKEYIKYNPSMSWLTPDSLYNSNVAESIALWTLEKHEKDWRPHIGGNIVPWVLSCYNQGARYTQENGVSEKYVDLVNKGMQ